MIEARNKSSCKEMGIGFGCYKEKQLLPRSCKERNLTIGGYRLSCFRKYGKFLIEI